MIQILFIVFFLYLPLQIYTAIKFDGVLGIITSVNAFLMIGVITYTGIAFLLQSNLWPLILLFTSPLALLVQIILVISSFIKSQFLKKQKTNH